MLAGHDLLLVDDGQPVVEAGQRAAREPAIDHERGPAALADGPRDVRGSGDHVAGGEDAVDAGLQGGRVGHERAVPVGRDDVGEGPRVGRHADRRDHDLAAHGELAAGDRLGAPAPGRVGSAQGHLRAAQAAHDACRIRSNLDRRGQEGELDPLALRVVDLGAVGRHLLAAAPVGDRDARRAQPPGGPRGVHRHVPPADDDDPPALEVGRHAEPHVVQELHATEDPRGLLAGDAQGGGPRRAGRHEDGVEPVAPQRGQVQDGTAGGDLDADVGDVLDVLLHDLGRQPVGRDGKAQEAARLRGRLEDLDAVAGARQLPGGRQARRAGAHDRDALPIGGCHRHAGAVEVLVMPVVGEALEPPDRERSFQLTAGALALARCVAGPPQGAGEWRRLQHQLERLLVLAVADQRHVAVRLDPGRTGVGARRAAAAIDDRLLGDGLREGDVRRPPGDHVRVELVGDRDGAGGLAELAAGAACLVDVAGLAPDPGVELPVAVALDALDLAVREGRDVVVVDRGRHLRRGDAAGAVQGGEDLAQQDHLPADAGVLLHDEDLVAHVAQLQGGLHPPDAAAHDEHVILHGGHLVADGPRATSAFANCCTCFVKGSAQTEQMAAIFSRWGEWPAALRSVCACAMMCEARSAQSGR